MRIALIAPFGLRAKGSARARALPLGQALAAHGHQVALFVPPYDSPADSGQAWSADGVDIRNVLLPPAALPGPIYHCALAWRLLRPVMAWRPDVVQVFKPKGPSGLVGAALWLTKDRPLSAARARATSGRPAIVVDSDDWEGAGGWNDDPRAHYSPVQRRFFAWQERYGLSHAHAWTVSSQCLRQRAVGFGAAAARVFVMPNGISPSAPTWVGDAVTGRAGPSPVGSPAALLYTRFAGVRVEDVVDIWKQVVTVMPDARLIVVGKGLAGEETQLARLAPGVDVRGWVEPQDLPAVCAQASVALVPWSDTPANRARNSAKVLELMAAGLPLVACAVGELPATLGDAGVLVPPGDAATFAAATVAVLRDRERGRRLGAAARARIGASFTWGNLADIALAAYEAAAVARSTGGVLTQARS